MFGLGTGIGAALAGIPGAAVGATVGKIADLGLAMLDAYVLDGLLKGWNPRMFVDEIRYESQEPEAGSRRLLTVFIKLWLDDKHST